jgi:hypothetical protein
MRYAEFGPFSVAYGLAAPMMLFRVRRFVRSQSSSLTVRVGRLYLMVVYMPRNDGAR